MFSKQIWDTPEACQFSCSAWYLYMDGRVEVTTGVLNERTYHIIFSDRIPWWCRNDISLAVVVVFVSETIYLIVYLGRNVYSHAVTRWNWCLLGWWNLLESRWVVRRVSCKWSNKLTHMNSIWWQKLNKQTKTTFGAILSNTLLTDFWCLSTNKLNAQHGMLLKKFQTASDYM